MKKNDTIIQKALEMLFEATEKGISNYKIAKDTEITEASIGNYVNKKTKPTPANAKIIIDYFNNKGISNIQHKVGNNSMGDGSYIVMGDNSSFNPNDFNYLLKVIADKDEFIKVLKDDYDKMHAEYDLRINNLFQQIKEKDKREELIVHNSYTRNEDAQRRFEEKDKLLAEKEAIIREKDMKITELYEKIIELSSNR